MKKFPRIAFVSDADHLVLPPDDLYLFSHLKSHADWEIVVWDDPKVNWKKYDLAVVRATWDYPSKLPAFKNWLDRMETERIPLANPPQLIRKNFDKNYLRDLEKQGICTVPTVWLKPGDEADFSLIFKKNNWEKAVVKPAVSNGAHNTWVISPENFAESRARAGELLAAGDELLVQPFLPEILTEGEWSLLYFNGTFSHAILKKAKPGDFRVQYIHGGTIHAAEATDKMIRFGKNLIETLPEMPLYARVDGVCRGAEFMLMELELIEPVLYIAKNEAAQKRWAESILVQIDVYRCKN